MNDIPLCEKFRPKDFSEVIGVNSTKTFEELIKTPMEMPNMLLYGPAGVGKSTSIKIIRPIISS